MNVEIKKLRSSAMTPTKGSNDAAGYDLYASLNEPIRINPHAVAKIPTGLSIAVPTGYAGFIFARSGAATKRGLRPANCVGICDADYRGEYIVALYNDSRVPQAVSNGDRIAQLVVMPVANINFCEVDDLENTDRGDNGFGSTGK